MYHQFGLTLNNIGEQNGSNKTINSNHLIFRENKPDIHLCIFRYLRQGKKKKRVFKNNPRTTKDVRQGPG